MRSYGSTWCAWEFPRIPPSERGSGHASRFAWLRVLTEGVDAFSVSKYEQIRLDHNSAKSSRPGRRFWTLLALASEKRIWALMLWKAGVFFFCVGWWLDDDFFFSKGSEIILRIFLVCYARGADFGAGRRFVFSQISRVCASVLYTRCNSVKNATLDASVAAHTAENGPPKVWRNWWNIQSSP